MTDKHSQKTFTDLDEMDMNPKERIAYEVRLKQRLDREAAVNEAKLRIEIAKKEGMERGFEQARALGIEKGRARQNITIVRNMLKANLDAEVVVKVTGLSMERVRKIEVELEL